MTIQTSLESARTVLAWGTLRGADFPERVEAAASAGFDSIGLMIRDYLGLRASGWTDDQLRRVLDDQGVTVDEVEVLFGFAGPPGPAGVPERPGLTYADPELEKVAFHMADVFGARHVQAVGRFAPPPAPPHVAEAFAALCDRAARHGLRVALEFVPYTDLPDVIAAAAVVAAAGRANGGLCVDSWHFFRGNPDLRVLRAVPPEQIFMVQINDGPLVPEDPNRMDDSVHHRRCPGEGEFALVPWLAAMDRPGLSASVSVEVYSDSLALLPPSEAAALALRSTRRVLATAPGSASEGPVAIDTE